MNSAESVIASLDTERARTLYISESVFEAVPYVFATDTRVWREWQHGVGEALQVDPKSILMVGSAMHGFSLSPSKQYKLFDESSDIDLAVISPHHFDVAWRWARRRNASWLKLPTRTRNYINNNVPNYVYWGCIPTDRILQYLPFGPDWIRRLAVADAAFVDNHEVNLRLYKDVDSLRSYHVRNLARLAQRGN